MKRSLVLTLLLGLACTMITPISFAQERTISGTVSDERAVTLRGDKLMNGFTIRLDRLRHPSTLNEIRIQQFSWNVPSTSCDDDL